MDGWLKLWRQVADNEIFKYDRTAWHVFEILLIYSKNGQWRGGRYQLAELCDLNPNTTKDAIKRLKKAEMVTTKSTNKFTIFTVPNWHRFQDRTPLGDTNKTPTKHQQNTTLIRIKEYKNKEIINITTLLFDLIKQNYPFLKDKQPSLKDYEEMEKLNRIDGYDCNIIEAVIRWSQQDAFWKQNIRSVAKLRKQFDTLLVKINSYKGANERKFIDVDQAADVLINAQRY